MANLFLFYTGPYGHHNNSGVPTTPSPYSPYEATDRPIGYLDMKPSYADPQTPTGTLGHGSQQGRFGDEDGAGEYDRQQHRPPPIDTSDMPRGSVLKAELINYAYGILFQILCLFI